MPNLAIREICFLAWGSPWPAMGGGSLRALGLLRELSRHFSIRLYVLSPRPLSSDQMIELRRFSAHLTVITMAGSSVPQLLRIAGAMIAHRIPYHAAKTWVSLSMDRAAIKQLRAFTGVVFCSFGHWGVLALNRRFQGLILDQQNADVDFWRVYATQTSRWFEKILSRLNGFLSAISFPRIYSNVGCIVSVCESDRQLTRKLAPEAKIEVIENGIDCEYYYPQMRREIDRPRILFTGTSAPRNVFALRQFCSLIWPSIMSQVPGVELLVAGNFDVKSQASFATTPQLRFTGRVEDIRPYFACSDVFIAPFSETHGSKLKIAEAMAMGMAIVSTPEGIRGFDLVDGESVFIAQNNEIFSSLVVSLLNDSDARCRVGRAAREVAIKTIDWRVLGKRLQTIVSELAGASS